MLQQSKNVIVHSQNNDVYTFGKCLLQTIKPSFKNEDLGIQVNYQYHKEKGQFQIYFQEDSKLNLLHSQNCPCFNKNWFQEPQKIVSLGVVGILKDSDNNFLLTRRQMQMRTFPQAWVFPGGMVDLGSDLVQEIIRETFEETGIKIENNDIIRPVAFYESIYPTVLNCYPARQTLVLFYSINVLENKKDIRVQPNEDEVDQYMWVSLENIKSAINGKCYNIPEINGIYPNSVGQGIAEGHLLVLRNLIAQNEI